MSMNALTLAAQTIKDNVSAVDVGVALGLEIRHGRCKCPIHNGNDFNCVLYNGNRGYYCHVCKAGGDVITFVQQYNSCTFKEAVIWLNDMFNLGLDIDTPLSKETLKRAEKVANERKERRELEEWKKTAQFGLALGVSQIAQYLEELRDMNEPKDPNGPWSNDFCDAIRYLPSAMRLAQDCWFDCAEVKAGG